MATAEQVLSIAKSFLGTSNGDYFIRKYNANTGVGVPLGSPWCAIFVSCVARMAGVPILEIPDFHGCTAGTRKFKNFGRWKDRAGYTPKPGDVIMFDWNQIAADGLDHTGIVERVENGMVHTIEGNSTSKGICARCSYPLNSGTITGYGTPVYGQKEAEQKEEQDMTKEEVIKIIEEREAEIEKKAVSKWAESAWKKLIKEGVFDGTMPKSPLTREQAALVITRLTGKN
jgi:CHAP domain.